MASITIETGRTLSSSSGAFINNTGGTITISGNGVLTNTATSGTISNVGRHDQHWHGHCQHNGHDQHYQQCTGGVISLAGGTLSAGLTGITNTGANTQITGFGTLIGGVTNSSGALIAVTGGNMTANSGITNTAAITIDTGRTLSSNSGNLPTTPVAPSPSPAPVS